MASTELGSEVKPPKDLGNQAVGRSLLSFSSPLTVPKSPHPVLLGRPRRPHPGCSRSGGIQVSFTIVRESGRLVFLSPHHPFARGRQVYAGSGRPNRNLGPTAPGHPNNACSQFSLSCRFGLHLSICRSPLMPPPSLLKRRPADTSTPWLETPGHLVDVSPRRALHLRPKRTHALLYVRGRNR